MSITYRHDGLKPFKITVKLSGKVVGHIKKSDVQPGYFYQPKGAKFITGGTFPTVEAVKRSIEGR